MSSPNGPVTKDPFPGLSTGGNLSNTDIKEQKDSSSDEFGPLPQSLVVIPKIIKVKETNQKNSQLNFNKTTIPLTKKDEIIKKHVKIHGEGNWDECVKSLPEMNCRSVKLRWETYIKPKLENKIKSFSKSDDEKLIEMVRLYGKKWLKIQQKEFPEFTDASLENRYRELKKKIPLH